MTIWARGCEVVIILKPGQNKVPSNHRIVSWVYHRACMQALENRKISCSCPELITNGTEFCLSWKSEVSPEVTHDIHIPAHKRPTMNLTFSAHLTLPCNLLLEQGRIQVFWGLRRIKFGGLSGIKRIKNYKYKIMFEFNIYL